MAYKPNTDSFFWTQAAWFVDPANSTGLASDLNDGKTALTPVLTWNGGVIVKWGTSSPVLKQNTTITFMSSAAPGVDPVIFTPTVVGCVVQLQGVLGAAQQIHAGNLAGVVAKNQTTGQLLNADLGFAAPIGSLVQNTQAGKVSYAWVYKHIAGTVFALTQPQIPSVQPFNFATATTEINTWGNGDSFVVFTPVSIELEDVRPQIAGFDVAANFAGTQIYHLNGITIDGGVQDSNFFIGVDVTLVESSFQSNVTNFDGYDDVIAAISNCFFAGGLYVTVVGATTVQLYAGAVVAHANVACVVPFALTNDVIIDGTISAPLIYAVGASLQLGSGVAVVGNVGMGDGSINLVNTVCWGTGMLFVIGTTRVAYRNGPGGAVATFKNLGGLSLNGQASVSAFNPASGTYSLGTIPLTPVNLDLAFGAGGFGGLAVNVGGASITNQASN